jgi:Sec-independent protein secretion pathway component TatC
MLALPMWALFEVGIIAGRLIRKKQVEEEKQAAS